MSTLQAEPPEAAPDQVEEPVMEEQMAPANPEALNQYHDRCDRCHAQAYVKTRHPLGRHAKDDVTEADLLWCGHHFNAFPVLKEFVVVNELERLDVKLVSSY